MAGYSDTPLLKKLGIKERDRVAFLNDPPGFLERLGKVPEGVQFLNRLSKPIDVAVLFVERQRVLANEFKAVAGKLSPAGMIWVAWPKKSSGVKTDLAFENVQKIGLAAGLVDVKICAVDDVWSGLKFVFRLKDRKKIASNKR